MEESSSQPLFSGRGRKWFDSLDRFVIFMSQHPYHAIFFAIILSFVLYGINSNPGQDYLAIARDPFVLYERAPHFQDSLFLPLTAHFLGLTDSAYEFELYTTVAFALAFFAIFYLASQNFSNEAALWGILTLTLSPASLICLIWMGLPDPFTVLFSGVLAFAGSIPILLLVAFLGVANHPQFLFISIAIVALRLSAREKHFRLRQVFSIGLGALAGYLAVQVFLNHYGVRIESTRLELMFQHDILDWLLVKALEAPMSIYSLYGGLWFVLALCFFYGFGLNKAYYLTLGILQLAAGALTFFTYDTTRIFALLTIGMLIHCVVFTYQLAIQRGHESIFRRVLIVLALVSIFLPHYIIWAGEMLFPRTYKIPALLVNIFFGR